MSAPGAWTILSVLDWTRTHFESKGNESPRLDAELILAHVLEVQRVMLYARFDQPLGKDELAAIRGLVARRARGEPMAYILGEREFYGLALEVTPDVLIPRPDTETLVEVALAALRGRDAARVVDVGTGSGAVALAIAREVASASVVAADISEAALAVARRNAARHGLEGRVSFIRSDLLRDVPGELDVVVANLPYIPSAVIATLARDVRDFEPRSALDGGPDGLDLVRRLASEARPRISAGGVIALEIGHDQGPAAEVVLREAGWSGVRLHPDLGGRDRVVEGRA